MGSAGKPRESQKKVGMAEYWANVFKTPGPERTAAIALLVMWAIAAIWGWFFVEPTILRESKNARDFVDFAVGVFPWIGNIKTLGPRAEEGLFLHSVYFFALAPGAVICNLVMVSRPIIAELATDDTPLKMLGGVLLCFVFAFLVIGEVYFYALKPSFGALHRTGYSLVASEFMTPIVAPFFIAGFWFALSSGFYFAYFSARKLISKR